MEGRVKEKVGQERGPGSAIGCASGEKREEDETREEGGAALPPVV